MRIGNQRRLVALGFALFVSIESLATAQYIPGRIETNAIRLHESLCDRFKLGDTNVPLLRIDSFEGPVKFASVTFASVTKDGKVSSGCHSFISNSSDWGTLSVTNLQLLAEAMDALPPSTTNTLALNRQIHVSGIRRTGCFHSVYDVNDCPKEVRKVFDLLRLAFR